MATTQQISNREAIIELAQGIGETSSAIFALTAAIHNLTTITRRIAGPETEFDIVQAALLRAEIALGESYNRAMMVLQDMAGDA